MISMNRSSLCLLVFILLQWQPGRAINCYQCSGPLISTCGEITSGNEPASVDCSGSGNKCYTTEYSSGGGTVTSVERGCSSSATGCVKTSGTRKCTCSGDLCNKKDPDTKTCHKCTWYSVLGDYADCRTGEYDGETTENCAQCGIMETFFNGGLVKVERGCAGFSETTCSQGDMFSNGDFVFKTCTCDNSDKCNTASGGDSVHTMPATSRYTQLVALVAMLWFNM